ncbi:MAG: hypothetical protein ACI845_004146 [Gammaproteobacteria bacterium]|jgi:uncharacterized protein (DUF1499 family)
MKWILILIAILVLAAVIALFVLGKQSETGQVAGIIDGKLRPCPDNPNCVCSEYPLDTGHFIEPLNLSEQSVEELLPILAIIVTEMGGKTKNIGTDHLHVTFSSAIFGFVDDFEIRIDSTEALIHFRSASRVGRSDLGTNRKRVELFRAHVNDDLK